MSTSVKIDREDKERLERLQALITLRMGKRVTQQEILSRLIKEAYDRSEDFIEGLFEEHPKLSDEEFERVLSLIEDWGVETSWEEIDKVLYGEEEA